MDSIQEITNRNEKKYVKILNNLLDIKGRDQTIFTNVNNTSSFDIKTKFGPKPIEKFFHQQSFTCKLIEQDLEGLLNILIKSNDTNEIINAYTNNNQRLFNTTKALLNNPRKFKSTKQALVWDLKEKIQKQTTRWKQFLRKAIDTNILDNIWPLHIATLFISIKTDRREIYAPLLLKEVSLNLQTSNITIKSEDNSWKLNEKALFLLKDAGYNFDENINIKEMDLEDALAVISAQFNAQIPIKVLNGKFHNLEAKDIKNTVIYIHPGVVLGLFKPSGGHLRKTMLEIIDNDQVDEIINVHPDKTSYRKNMDKFIKQYSDKLFRIQPSNFSQDKALASSLIQDTIIWGPPGTGKSQVIANIISNIFMQNKTAVVVSQKKAALDVLKKRLGSISPFALFILNDNKMIKSEFYAPLQKFVEMIENSSFISKNEPTKIITQEEIKSLKIISNAKKSGNYHHYMEIIKIFGRNSELISALKNINGNLSYPNTNNKYKNYLKSTANLNNLNKKGFWIFKWYPQKFKAAIKSACFIFNQQQNLNINEIKHLSQYAHNNLIQLLINTSNNLKRTTTYKSDEEYIASCLGKKNIEKISSWKLNDKEKYKDYKRFANAVRAGRRLPYKFTNDHIPIIRELFPIIITTPETSFITWKQNSFDYAILDESSQLFLEIGLPILYLAKTKILAGDNQQMQPSRWFATRDETENEEDIAENAESLLDYAFDKGVFQIMLDQNYRSSSASLMAFSAKHFYNSKLEVIDDKKLKSETPISVLNVDGIWEKGINKKEAQKVINLAKIFLISYKSIILLTFNSSQRQWIEKNILENEDLLQKAMDDERLMIRNIENIQGDEADIVIASVVYDPTTNIGSTYVVRSGGMNALNVAISRARHRMIVVKSVTSKTIRTAKSEDFKVFKSWLKFLDMNSKDQQQYSKIKNDEQNSVSPVDKDAKFIFKKEVIKSLKKNIAFNGNIKLVPEYEVGSKRIDIALFDDEDNYLLGIELDNYKYHGELSYDKYLENLSRQTFMKKKGYDIFQIKEIDWKLNPQKIVNKIKQIIE